MLHVSQTVGSLHEGSSIVNRLVAGGSKSNSILKAIYSVHLQGEILLDNSLAILRTISEISRALAMIYGYTRDGKPAFGFCNAATT